MQQPTFTGLRVESPADSHVVFHAVALGVLPMVVQRLTPEERQLIQPGSIFVWEERCPVQQATGTGMERWTDGRRWSASRVRDEFLLYQEVIPELDADDEVSHRQLRNRLVKKTYSVYVDLEKGRRKWHLVAYYTQESLERLHAVDDVPMLAALRAHVPEGRYASAKSSKGRARTERAGAWQGANRASATPPDPPGPYGPAPRTPTPTLYPVPRSPAPTPTPQSASACLPDPQEAQRRQSTSQGLAPLVYNRMSPYAPRHPIDNIALRSFDRAMF